MAYQDRRIYAAFRYLLGVVMSEAPKPLAPLSAVALLADVAAHGLVRGQVGTIVECLDEATALVEFSDDEGRAYALTPCLLTALLPLRTAPLAA